MHGARARSWHVNGDLIIPVALDYSKNILNLNFFIDTAGRCSTHLLHYYARNQMHTVLVRVQCQCMHYQSYDSVPWLIGIDMWSGAGDHY